jgi:hypothetical protein
MTNEEKLALKIACIQAAATLIGVDPKLDRDFRVPECAKLARTVRRGRPDVLALSVAEQVWSPYLTAQRLFFLPPIEWPYAAAAPVARSAGGGSLPPPIPALTLLTLLTQTPGRRRLTGLRGV